MSSLPKRIEGSCTPCMAGDKGICNCIMERPKSIGIDDDQYRSEVLRLPSEELETAQQEQLVEEAQQLGLKVPDIEIVASLAASIASGIVDLSSPIVSSGSSTDRNSTYDVSQSSDTPQLDQITSSFSEYTISSYHAECGSARSIASLSTRPTSYSSSDGKLAYGTDGIPTRYRGHRNSLLSVASSIDKKERRRSSLKSAIGKIYFRKKRSPSTVLLPPAAQITIAKGEEGGSDKLYVESKPSEPQQSIPPDEESEDLKLEIPVFDNEALLRSLGSVELKQMRETQTLERNRHILFQNNFIRELRHRQQTIINDRLAQNHRLEEEKREQSSSAAVRMEERQLVVEMEQIREFERAKTNSRTRIKYMEGYMSSSSPPMSRSPSISGSDMTTPSRSFTQQHRAQLAQEYHDYDSMDQLHDAKIKVLRDRQEIRLQEALARMERELEALIDNHAAEFAELQKEHRQEEGKALQLFDTKKTQLRNRWILEEAILRKKLELEHGKPYGPLPHLSFSDSQGDTRDSAICVSEHAGTTSDDEESTRGKVDAPAL